MTSLNSKDTSKVYLHDQEMAGGESDGTSISTNLAKRETTRKEGQRRDKGRGEPTEKEILKN